MTFYTHKNWNSKNWKQHISKSRFFAIKYLIRLLHSMFPKDATENEELWERTIIEKDGVQTYTFHMTVVNGRLK